MLAEGSTWADTRGSRNIMLGKDYFRLSQMDVVRTPEFQRGDGGGLRTICIASRDEPADSAGGSGMWRDPRYLAVSPGCGQEKLVHSSFTTIHTSFSLTVRS